MEIKIKNKPVDKQQLNQQHPQQLNQKKKTKKQKNHSVFEFEFDKENGQKKRKTRLT